MSLPELAGPPPWPRGHHPRPIAVARPSVDPAAADRAALRTALAAHRRAERDARVARDALAVVIRRAHGRGLSYRQLAATLDLKVMSVHRLAMKDPP